MKASLKFWSLALLWLPAGLVLQASARFAFGSSGFPDAGVLAEMLLSLLPCVAGGLPLALACRSLWRLGYRRAAMIAGGVMGLLTIPATLFAGLLGPLPIMAWALVLSLPVWGLRVSLHCRLHTAREQGE